MHVPPSQEAAHRPSFRRRIPLELTADQLALLERWEAQYGTKRATLIAGLEALARLEAIEQELTEQTSACEQALAKADEFERKLSRAQAEAGQTKSEAAAAKKAGETNAQALTTAKKAARAETDQLRRALAAEQASGGSWKSSWSSWSRSCSTRSSALAAASSPRPRSGRAEKTASASSSTTAAAASTAAA